MLSELEICLENRLCIWRIGGRATIEALCDGYAQRFTHPDWAPDLMSLTVLHKLGMGSITPDQAAMFAKFVKECDEHYQRRAGRAAIVCEEETARALLFYWDKMASKVLGREERSFASEADAKNWLVSERTNAAA